RSSFDLYFSSHDYGYLVDDESIDLQYMRVFLFETLGSLGLVDLAYVFPHFLWPEFEGVWGTDELPFCGKYDGLLYVRLNELGAYCLSLTETFQPGSSADRDDLRILPNYDIVLSNPHPSASILTHMLDLIAVRSSDLVRRIDRDKVLGYLGTGGSAEDLLNFLETHAPEGVPENVRSFLEDIAVRARTLVSSEEAVVIETANEESAAAVAADPRTAKICSLTQGRFLVVRKSNLRAFESALMRMGYLLPK
ncbi:MAG: hypothetical protein V2B18_04370, partial [Pseudomonadota bacterium]